MKVYLIRHGETPGNRLGRYIGITDEPLLAEAQEKLKKKNVWEAETVFSSPLRRCRQTAEILFPGQPVTVLEELAECDFGIFENKNWKELTGNAAYQSWIDSNGTLPFPGGENPSAFHERCCRGFEKAIADCLQNGIKTAAFTIHGGTIMSIMERYAAPHRDFYDWHVKNGAGYQVEIAQKCGGTRLRTGRREEEDVSVWRKPYAYFYEWREL